MNAREPWLQTMTANHLTIKELFASIISNQVPLNAKSEKETLKGFFKAKSQVEKPIECSTSNGFSAMLFKVKAPAYAIL
jgi:hypothetical protein